MPDAPIRPGLRLLDLDPHWATKDGRRVGIFYLCPCCLRDRLYTVTDEAGGGNHQQQLSILLKCGLLPNARIDEDDGWIYEGEPSVVCSKFGIVWTMTGDNFSDVTLSPSVDASGSGNWHGHIQGGMVV